MRTFLVSTILVGLVAVPALAQKVTVDYSSEFDYGSVKTFQYVPTKDSNARNPMMDDRIRGAIVRELKEGGLTQVDSNPDIFVTYHLSSKDNTVYNTTNFGYGGMWGGWHGWGMGMGSSTTTASTYTEGTLIIDAYDAKEKKMIWRGTGTVTVKSQPEKQIRQVDKILDKLGARWDKILAKQGK